MHERIPLAHYRERKGLTQADLAKLVGVSQATISRLENQEQNGSVQLLAKVARALGVELVELLPEEESHGLGGEQTTFYAFCPDPFCSRNQLIREFGEDKVQWRSGESYSIDMREEVNFCSRCGSDLVKQCQSCERLLNERGSRYCIRCGAQLHERPTPDDWAKIREILDEREREADEIPF